MVIKRKTIYFNSFYLFNNNNLGAKVSDTIRKGIIDPGMFEPKELMLGQLSSLIGNSNMILIFLL